MSYSFSVKAPTKAEAKAAVAMELEKVVAAQPIHAKDAPQALAAADAFIDLLDDRLLVDSNLEVNVNGSLSWLEDERVTWANVAVTAHRVVRG